MRALGLKVTVYDDLGGRPVRAAAVAKEVGEEPLRLEGEVPLGGGSFLMVGAPPKLEVATDLKTFNALIRGAARWLTFTAGGPPRPRSVQPSEWAMDVSDVKEALGRAIKLRDEHRRLEREEPCAVDPSDPCGSCEPCRRRARALAATLSRSAS
jgi:hypothetical protein